MQNQFSIETDWDLGHVKERKKTYGMEIKIASQKLNSETAPITFPGRNSTNGSGSQRKSIQEDVLIYTADRAEKWARGEHSFQHTKRQVRN